MNDQPEFDPADEVDGEASPAEAHDPAHHPASDPASDPAPEPEPDGEEPPSEAHDLSRTITPSGKAIVYAPGDYLFNLAAKLVVYVADPGKPPLFAELRALSPVLSQLHAVLSPTSPTHNPHADNYHIDWVDLLLQELHTCPRLQQPLAYIVNYVPSKWLLEQEASVIRRARRIHERQAPRWPDPNDSGMPFRRNDPSTWLLPDTVNEWAWRAGLSGLCLSGGGIRSATFNLGILQQLAAQKKIQRFDYLCSVSGGGYIHAWLAAWLRRESGRQHEALRQQQAPGTAPDPAAAHAATRAALAQVEKEMSPIPGRATVDASTHIFPARELRWLRQFSNYLTPQKGLFTLDTWTAGAIWLRNTFLNQLFLVSALLCMLLIPSLLAKVWLPDAACAPRLATPAASTNTVTFKGTLESTEAAPNKATFSVKAVKTEDGGSKGARVFKADYFKALSAEAGRKRSSAVSKPSQTAADRQKSEKEKAAEDDTRITVRTLESLSFALFLAGTLLLHGLLRNEVNYIRGQEDAADAGNPCQQPYRSEPASEQTPQCRQRESGSTGRVLFILASLLFPAVPFCYALCWPGPQLLEVVFATIAFLALSIGVAFGGDAFRLTGTPTTWQVIVKRVAVSIGATVFGTAVFMLVAALIRTAAFEHWGASLMDCPDPALELALGAPLLASIPFFTISVLIGLIGRSFFDWLRELLGRLLGWTLLLTLYWLGFFTIALLSPGLFLYAIQTTAIKVSSVLVWIATTAASVVSGKSPATAGSPSETKSGFFNAELLATVGPYVYILGLLVILSLGIQLAVGGTHPALHALIALAAFLTLSILLCFRLDATAFSLFPFYRNRLTRCYLGASNRSRDPSPLTGFDDRDTRGLQLRCLRPDHDYPGPFPIFSAAINLTTGTELAYQERKAAAFAFTPLYTGYAVSWTEGAPGTSFNGYVPTETYAAPQGGLNVASAIAISGAAVSPNWGYHSKPATAFLLTMFNARLGCWLPNTRRQEENSGRRSRKQYQVTLTVKDASGKTATATTIATIANSPIANAGGPYSGAPGQGIVFNGKRSSGLQAPLTYAWNLGDGSTATEASPTHSYDLPGVYLATLRVTDASGETSSTTTTVAIATTPAAGAPLSTALAASVGGTYNGTPDQEIVFDGSTSTGAQPLTCAWDFGDGCTATGIGARHTYSTEIPDSPDGRVLFNELSGRTDDSSEFIYLSDGGHFDNMGLYELVRRHCYDIVICDAEEDAEYIFDGIGQTIRKCRIDFGVEIDLDFSQLRCVAKTRFSAAHVVSGFIRYPEFPDRQGKVTYIKASLVTFPPASGSMISPSDLPNLPGDVQSYYLQHKEFPHDSTLEQWFTESQFESYRRLGQAVIEAMPPLAP